MISYIKIKLAKTILETVKTTEVPAATKETTTPRVPSKSTRTSTGPPRNQRKRKASSVRRSPRKKKPVRYIEDATEIQSSETKFTGLLSSTAAATDCDDKMKGNATAVVRSTETVSTNAQTGLSSAPEASPLTAERVRKKDTMKAEAETEPETEVAVGPEPGVASYPDVKGREVFYASSVLQHFALRADSSSVKTECPIHGRSEPTDESPYETPTSVDALKENENVGYCQGSQGVKESEKVMKNAKTVKKKEDGTDDTLFTNEGERIKL